MVADPSRSRSRRKLRRKLTGAQWEKMIRELRASWDAAAIRAEEKRLEREKRNLRRDVPSSPWFDAKWEEGHPFPPGGDETRMHRCTVCDHFTPPNNLGNSGACDCCRLGAMTPMQLESLPSSPGCVVDFRGLKGARKRHSVS